MIREPYGINPYNTTIDSTKDISFSFIYSGDKLDNVGVVILENENQTSVYEGQVSTIPSTNIFNNTEVQFTIPSETFTNYSQNTLIWKLKLTESNTMPLTLYKNGYLLANYSSSETVIETGVVGVISKWYSPEGSSTTGTDNNVNYTVYSYSKPSDVDWKLKVKNETVSISNYSHWVYDNGHERGFFGISGFSDSAPSGTLFDFKGNQFFSNWYNFNTEAAPTVSINAISNNTIVRPFYTFSGVVNSVGAPTNIKYYQYSIYKGFKTDQEQDFTYELINQSKKIYSRDLTYSCNLFKNTSANTCYKVKLEVMTQTNISLEAEIEDISVLIEENSVQLRAYLRNKQQYAELHWPDSKARSPLESYSIGEESGDPYGLNTGDFYSDYKNLYIKNNQTLTYNCSASEISSDTDFYSSGIFKVKDYISNGTIFSILSGEGDSEIFNLNIRDNRLYYNDTLISSTPLSTIGFWENSINWEDDTEWVENFNFSHYIYRFKLYKNTGSITLDITRTTGERNAPNEESWENFSSLSVSIPSGQIFDKVQFRGPISLLYYNLVKGYYVDSTSFTNGLPTANEGTTPYHLNITKTWWEYDPYINWKTNESVSPQILQGAHFELNLIFLQKEESGNIRKISLNSGIVNIGEIAKLYLYRQRLAKETLEIEENKFLAELLPEEIALQQGEKIVKDFTIPNRGIYTYEIVSVPQNISNPIAIVKFNTSDPPIQLPLSIDWFTWSFYPLIETENHKYRISDSWQFKLNTSAPQYKINTKTTFYQNFAKFPTVSISDQQYLTQSFSGLLGDFQYESKLKDEEEILKNVSIFTDDIARYEGFYKFITAKNEVLVKDPIGNTYIAILSNPSISSDMGLANPLNTVSFTITQIGDITDYQIIGEQSNGVL